MKNRYLDLALEIAQTSFKAQGRLIPMIVMHKEDGESIPILSQFNDNKEKDIILAAVKLMMLRYQAYSYTFMTEAWMVKRKEGENLQIRPSEQPDKIECIVVGYIGHDVKSMVMYEIKRGDSLELEEIVNSRESDFTGPWSELLPRQGQTLSEPLKIAADELMERFKL